MLFSKGDHVSFGLTGFDRAVPPHRAAQPVPFWIRREKPGNRRRKASMGCTRKTDAISPCWHPFLQAWLPFRDGLITPFYQYPARLAACQGTLFKNAALCRAGSRRRSCRRSTRVD